MQRLARGMAKEAGACKEANEAVAEALVNCGLAGMEFGNTAYATNAYLRLVGWSRRV